MKQNALYKIVGMQKDVADSAMDKQHAFDIRNMRLRHDDKNTLTALVNEPGTLKALDKNGKVVRIKGTVIGFNTIGDTGILFTHEEDGISYAGYSSPNEPTQFSYSDTPIPVGVPSRRPQQEFVSDTWCKYTLEYNGNQKSSRASTTTIIRGTASTSDSLSTVSVTLTITEFNFFAGYSGVVRVTSDSFISFTSDGIQDNAISSFGEPITINLTIIIPTTAQGARMSSITLRPSSVGATDIVSYEDLVISFNVVPYGAPPQGGGGGSEPTPGEDPEEEEEQETPITPVERYDEELGGACPDHIYLIDVNKKNEDQRGYDADITVTEYFRGNLGFDAKYPIESTVYFENDEVKKVYWVDGKKPLRYANIARLNKQGTAIIPWTDNLMFDSVPMLHLQEDVKVTRSSSGGVFPSGTVQFAFTYLNKYGAESNIAWISPIYYSSPDDRGGAPDEICANSFTIKIRRYEPDSRFDYIRLYHIMRTTLDAEAEVRRVADIAVPAEWSDTITFTDTNTTGEAVDPNELLYLGGNSIIPYTIEQKSNTLFLGNLKNNYQYLRDVDLESLLPWGHKDNNIEFFNGGSNVPADKFSGYYSHENQLLYSSHQITSFRRGEDYRFGFQAQDRTGRWSDVWWIGDKLNDMAYPQFNDGYFKPVHAKLTLSPAIVSVLRDAGYRTVRPVVVYPKPWERNIYTDGLLNPTVYNVKDRANNAPFAQSSWFLRPFSPVDMSTVTATDFSTDIYGNVGDTYKVPYPECDEFKDQINWSGDWYNPLSYIAIDSLLWDADGYSNKRMYDFTTHGSWAEFRHNHPLGDSQQRNGEIQSMYNPRISSSNESSSKYTITFPYVTIPQNSSLGEAIDDFIRHFGDFFYVDQSILTLNSADIEFDQSLQAVKFGDCHMKLTGFIPIHSFISSCDIRTNTPPNKFYDKDNNSLKMPQGFYNNETVGAPMELCGFGWKSLISAGLWHDDLTWSTVNSDGYQNDPPKATGFAVYPWQGQGSLNNDSIGSRKTYPNHENTTQDPESKSNVGDNYISAELKYKTIANLHYSNKTFYVENPNLCNTFKVYADTVLDSQAQTLHKIKDDVFNSVNYFGQIDKLIVPIIDGYVQQSDSWTAPELSRAGGYPRMVSYLPHFVKGFSGDNLAHLAFCSPYSPLSQFNTLSGDSSTDPDDFSLKAGVGKSMSPIPMRYNSCSHVVVSFNHPVTDQGNHKCRPVLGWGGVETKMYPLSTCFWSKEDSDSNYPRFAEMAMLNEEAIFVDNAWSQVPGVSIHHGSFDYINFEGKYAGYLYMGQLCRKTAVPNKFGGDSDEALEQNIWMPAGDAVYLDNPASHVYDDDEWLGIDLVWSAGDTYYQRYDALRTYPQTEEDMNKVIDIVSFMTETHVNIDGRYDRNRGLQNNNHVRPKNFNLMNYAYSQQNNFFTYNAKNLKKINLDTFRYSFTWSVPKTAGSLRDEWTRVTMANCYDCDGNKGSLNRIVRLDNMLVAFQDDGVSQILFNETSQVQATDGLPFELANSGKMQGLRYYTTEVGCQNKWSISVAPNGIYFLDGKSRKMYMLGEGIQDISSAQGMASWFKAQSNLLDVWNPSDWKGYRSHWDNTTGELFLMSDANCLCFDTGMGVFSSFYDYRYMDAMFTLGDTVITVARDNGPEGRYDYDPDTTRFINLWLHRKNRQNYCYLFNKQFPSSVEIICNSNNEGSDYGLSKVFDNMNWRADAWEWGNNDWQYRPFTTFTHINGFDNYQTFSEALVDPTEGRGTQKPGPAHNLRKKFKVWYTTIPRAESSSTFARDRIRDTWCHITLTLGENVSKYRHVLHDISVTYFIP